jgi:ADP-ribose pyrophosphatase YjhB (NUDIX family)
MLKISTNNTSRKKAGIFIYDKSKGRVLYVRSYSLCWGPPKGGIEPDETLIGCAIREVAEETGIRVFARELLRVPTIRVHSCTFFILNVDSECARFQPSVIAFKERVVTERDVRNQATAPAAAAGTPELKVGTVVREGNDVDANGWFCMTCVGSELALNSYGKKMLKWLTELN